jgi:hypothetical protein
MHSISRWSAKPGRKQIVPLGRGGGDLLGGITVTPIAISGTVADSGNLSAIISEHTREIARVLGQAGL